MPEFEDGHRRVTDRQWHTGVQRKLPVLARVTGRRMLSIAATIVAILCLLPLVAVVVEALSGSFDTTARLGTSLLPGYGATTIVLMGLVALGTVLTGTATAWLVAACEFAGRRWLEFALVLPLAFPAYVLAYAYTDLLDHPGLVQTQLRALTGWGARDYWFPEIRSLGGASVMLTLVLYPYIYLLARTAFLMQGVAPYVVARSVGCPPLQAFRQIALPLVSPAITAGLLLVLMETIADFGTVAHFGVQTLATGIYTTWFTLGDRVASAQMALSLLAIALLLLLLERSRARSQAALAQNPNRSRWPRIRLSGWRGLAAFAACFLPVLLGAIVPVIMLVTLARRSDQNWLGERYLGFLANSLTVAGIAAVVTVIAAIVLSYNSRLTGSRSARAAVGVARMGYAVPGAVIALGLFVPVAFAENALDGWMRATFDVSTGLFLSGSIVLLVMVYMIRFLSAALGAWRAGEVTVTLDLDHAAANLGARAGTTLRRVHLPLLRPAVLTAALLVFVDAIKELPATLIIRPFGWDTLAVQAYRLAADERLAGAAIPSLLIVAIGLLPVILVCNGLRGRV